MFVIPIEQTDKLLRVLLRRITRGQARSWSLDFHRRIYEIQGFRLVCGGSWLPDPEQRIVLPTGTAADEACARMIEILREAHSTRQS